MERNLNKNNPAPPVQNPPVQPKPKETVPVAAPVEKPAAPAAATPAVTTPPVSPKMPVVPPKLPSANRKKGVILVKKEGLDYYDESLPSVVTFPYPQGTVSDLEILDKEALERGIEQFIDQNKLTPATVFIIFSETTIFEKMIEGATAKEPNVEAVQSFLDNVPFEHVSYKTYDTPKGSRVIAVNEDLFKDLDEVLERKGFIVTFAVPDFLAPETAGKTTLNAASGQAVLTKIDVLKKQALIIDGISGMSESGFTTPQGAKEGGSKSTLPILLPVLGVLAVILVVVIFLQFREKPKASPIPQTIVAPTVIPPTEIPTETPASTSSATPTKISK